MSLDFDSYEINDICDINNSSYSKKESWSFFNYLDTKNITKGKIDEIKYLDPLEDIIPSRAKRKVNNKDIIYSTVRPNQEHYGLIENQPDNFLVSTGFTTLRVNTAKAIPEYVFYFITQNYITESLQTIAEQSTTSYPSIKSSDIGKLLIPVPPLNIQRKISQILRNIDYKINLNEKINSNLEQLILSIFNNWFINFEPFKNSSFVDSDFGFIPKNWKVSTIGDYCKLKSGFAFKSAWWQEKGIKVIKIKNINQGNINLSDCSCVSEDKIKKAEDFRVIGGDLLIAMTGATLGKFSIVPKYDEPLFVNQRVGKFFLGDNPLDKLPFLWCLLNQQRIIDEIINRGQGSAQANISPKDIETIKIILPSQEIINKFNEEFKIVFQKMIYNSFEIMKLENLRDTLLPKLMSGEIDVSKINCDLNIVIYEN